MEEIVQAYRTLTDIEMELAKTRKSFMKLKLSGYS